MRGISASTSFTRLEFSGCMVSKSEKVESADEHKKLTAAVSAVAHEMGTRLLYPVYRRHKDLVPKLLKGELL